MVFPACFDDALRDSECVCVDDCVVGVGHDDVSVVDFAGVAGIGKNADDLVPGPGAAHGGAVPVLVEFGSWSGISGDASSSTASINAVRRSWHSCPGSCRRGHTTT